MQPLKRPLSTCAHEIAEGRVGKCRKIDPTSIWLPTDIWSDIIKRSLAYPPVEQLSVCSLVSQEWLNLCTHIKIDLINQGTEIRILFNSFSKKGGNGFFGQDVMRVLFHHWQSIKNLNLGGCIHYQAQLQFISNFSHLEHLKIRVANSINLEALSNLINLKSIELPCLNEKMNFVTSFTKLQSFAAFNYDYDGLDLLNNLTRMERLKLEFASIRGSSLLPNFTNLKELNFKDIDFDHSSLYSISQLTKLEILRLRNLIVPENSDLLFLSNLLNLQSLSLKCCEWEDDDGNRNNQIHVLGRLTNLTKLNLARVTLDKMDLPFIANLTRLQILNLDHTYIDTQNLRYFSGLTALTFS